MILAVLNFIRITNDDSETSKAFMLIFEAIFFVLKK
jgi:hypothetical protein